MAATHPEPYIGKIYPEIAPPLQYTSLPTTRHRIIASHPQSGCPRNPEAEPWSSAEEAMLRARRIAAFEGFLSPDHFSEVMGGDNQSPDANTRRIFRDTRSNLMTETYGKGSFLTKHVFGIYSTIRVQVLSKFIEGMFAHSLTISDCHAQSHRARQDLLISCRKRNRRSTRGSAGKSSLLFDAGG